LELHIPKGKEVHLKIRAKDVLHSVFLPHFRVKMDAVPGMYTNFKFIPTKSTADMRNETGNPNFNYEMACTEICGKGHFSMRFLVVVDEPEDFEKWKAAQEPWLKQNPDYLSKVPSALREVAMIKSGIPIESTAGGSATTQTVSISN
jgi:cytochrome c oxidase subunit 2